MANTRTLRKKQAPPSMPDAPLPESPEFNLSDYLHETIGEFPLFARRLLKIQTKQGDLVDFEVNEVQTLLENIMQDIRNQGRLVRLVILKARRKGISTWVSGRFHWKTITAKNRYSMIVTHDPEVTDFIFKMHKRFLDHMPFYIRPTERYNNKRILEFNNDDGTGLDSAIRVATAGKEDVGSGMLIHYLHLSELAKYPAHLATNLLLSLLQTVPRTPDTEVIIESTAKGIGGEFYSRYWGARYKYDIYIDKEGNPQFKSSINKNAPEDSDYAAIFIPWYALREYQKEPKPGFKIDDPEFYESIGIDKANHEKELIEKYGVTLRQLAWRRWCIVDQCNSNLELFNQEYPEDDVSAFISSSDNVFSVRDLKTRMETAFIPKVKYDINPANAVFVAAENGKFEVWEEPFNTRKYLISADVSEGIIAGDFSAFHVIDIIHNRQVASWHGHIAPDMLGLFLIATGYRYNMAQIVVERNNHGISTLDKLIQMQYPNIYCETVIEPPNKPRKRYGWVTTKTSKPAIIMNLAAEFRDKQDGIRSYDLLEEMMFFKQHEDMTYGAEEGHVDDRVIAYAIGKYVLSKMPHKSRLAQKNVNFYNQTGQRRANRPSFGSGAWT